MFHSNRNNEYYTKTKHPNESRHSIQLVAKKQLQNLDTDLWRLESWLSDTEAKINQFTNEEAPDNADQLGDAVQSNKELMLSMTSHRPVVKFLKSLGRTVIERIELESTKDEFRNRLAGAMQRWELTSRGVTKMHGYLQANLLQNDDFHDRLATLTLIVDKMESKIKQTEPVNLNADTRTLKRKYHTFKELKEELSLCEPRVVFLYSSVNMLFDRNVYSKSATQIKALYQQLRSLNRRVSTLIKLCDTYCERLYTENLENHTDSILSLSSGLFSSSGVLESEQGYTNAPGRRWSYGYTEEVYDQPEAWTTTCMITIKRYLKGYKGDAGGSTAGTISTRSGGISDFLRRTFQASIPIQALMIFYVGFANFVPYTEDGSFHNSVLKMLCNLDCSSHFLLPSIKYDSLLSYLTGGLRMGNTIM